MFDPGLTPEQEQRAADLHRDLVVIDMLTESSLPENLFQNMLAGGLTCGSFTIGTAGLKRFHDGILPHHEHWWSRQSTVEDLSLMQGLLADPGNDAIHITSAADIRRAKAEGKVGVLLNVQNSICIGTDIDHIDFFYHLGLRVIQLTYNLQNFVASGCLEDPKKMLSNFGIEAIGRMNERGMLVDTGHTGEGSILHAVAVSEKPIACSHAGLAALSSPDNPRVVSDKALRAIAEKGGVFGLTAIPGMLTGGLRCTLDDWVDHLQHAINTIGINGVGIGSDFIAGASLAQIATSPDWKGKEVPTSLEVWPVCDGHEGFENHAKYGNVTRALVARGYSDSDIAKLMGGNWLRLIEDTIG
ncbi:MAG: dipeptidase [Lysobacterales bacterium]